MSSALAHITGTHHIYQSLHTSLHEVGLRLTEDGLQAEEVTWTSQPHEAFPGGLFQLKLSCIFQYLCLKLKTRLDTENPKPKLVVTPVTVLAC